MTNGFDRLFAILTTPSVPLVLALTSLVACVLIWWAAAAVYRNEQWLEAERLRRSQERRERCWDEVTGEEWRWDNEPEAEQSCTEQAGSLSHAELRRIIGAMVVETCEAREHVRQGRMQEAEESLHLVIGCQHGLLDRCDGKGGAV
jgi:hypothetical protein